MVVPVDVFFAGLAWALLWHWFAEPIFAVHITTIQAAGLYFLKTEVWPTPLDPAVQTVTVGAFSKTVLEGWAYRLFLLGLAYTFHMVTA